jgi:SAM-dependent methyltransferase
MQLFSTFQFPVLHIPSVAIFSNRAGYSAVDDAIKEFFNLPQEPHKIVVFCLSEDHCQIELFTAKQAFTKHISPAEREKILPQIQSLAMKQVLLQTPERDTIVLRSFTKEGLCKSQTVRTTKPSRKHWHLSTANHTEYANDAISPHNGSAILRGLGITDEHNTVIPAMSDKYRQINHFIGIAQTLDIIRNAQQISPKPLRIIDCGCGKAYLSLALAQWLVLQGIAYELVGIDTNSNLIERCNVIAKSAGLHSARFVCMPIGAYSEHIGDTACDVVIALHACDTATDDALHLAIQAQAKAILSAPCCHHFVNVQLRSQEFKSSAPESTALLLRDGITRERLADLLTDSMRRDILFGYGYRAELLEFTAPEHTMKNIMIRAELTTATPAPQPERLKRFFAEQEQWHIAPKLAELLNLSSAENPFAVA